MRKTIIQKITYIFLFLVLITPQIIAQHLMYEVPLSQQVKNASLIIEGEVIGKRSYWNADNTKIFTINTVEVFKVFKGEPIKLVEVITKGGTVGLNSHRVNPSLKLRIGDVGVFMLETHSVSFESSKGFGIPSFKPYSSKQGFYKYSLEENLVVNPFRIRKNISGAFYQELKNVTKTNFDEVKKYDIDVVIFEKKSKLSKILATTITGFSPAISTAGTKSVLTITGTEFGTAQGTGVVEFKNADDGGATFIEALATEVLNWSDTEITVEIPSDAGTGIIRVDPDGNAEPVASQFTLTISYAQINVTSDAVDSEVEVAYQTQHTNLHAPTGGIEWNMNTDFNEDVNFPGAKASFEKAMETWRCETGVNWTISNNPVPNDSAESDDVNVITFSNGDTGNLGACTSYFSGCFINGGTDVQWYVNEIDIVFNSAVSWYTGTETPGGSEHDFESVAVHELGHGHQLGHVIAPGTAIMHYAFDKGDAFRMLSSDDIDGANDVHSRSTSIDVCSTIRSEGVMADYAGVCPTTSLDNHLLDEGISIYPNPTELEFRIENSTQLNLQNAEVYDATGRLLIQKELNGLSGSAPFDVTYLSQGLYFVKIIADEGSTTKRFLKK
ncbi:MAG: hypothetical protein BM563_01290 [Bacteroidetes bacterium MedPE-SWsnd-G1]|nr:MAG: hypothetical protein BM563_01290 [Bacteroidetes bacterium MedPE-SWsnd-G1]